MRHSILMHEKNDDVGVAVEDLFPGAQVGAVTLEGEEVGTVRVVDEVPLGHKVALKDVASGAQVTEYGRVIGTATAALGRGAHVHTHNLKTQRWKV